MIFGSSVRNLKLYVDTALYKPGILDELGAFRTEGLLKHIPRVEDRLDLAGQDPPSRQILNDRDAESGVVVFHQPLVSIDSRDRKTGHPSVNRRDLGLGEIHIRLEARGQNLHSISLKLA